MDIGYAILYTAFITSIAAVIIHIAGIVKKNETFFDNGRTAIIVSALLLTTASFYILYLTINRDHNVGYIALQTSNDLSFIYTISTLRVGSIAITFGTIFAVLGIVVNKRKKYYETRYAI